jgi:hypothetical protein
VLRERPPLDHPTILTMLRATALALLLAPQAAVGFLGGGGPASSPTRSVAARRPRRAAPVRKMTDRLDHAGAAAATAPFFPAIPEAGIQYEGPKSKNPLAYHYYNADEVGSKIDAYHYYNATDEPRRALKRPRPCLSRGTR